MPTSLCSHRSDSRRLLAETQQVTINQKPIIITVVTEDRFQITQRPNLSVLELLLNILDNASTFQALKGALKKLGPDLAGPGHHAGDGHQFADLGGGELPQLLDYGEVVEGEVDVLVGVVIGDEGGFLLHDESLAGALQVGLEPQVLFGDRLLEEIVEDHHVGEVDEHGGRLVGSHRFDLRLVNDLARV